MIISSNTTHISKNWKYIDFLKGIAMLGVILVHFNQSFTAPSTGLKALSGFGEHGVQLFFMISAFLLWHSFSKFKNPSVKDSIGFVKSKLSRIYPLFVVALIVCIVLSLFGGVLSDSVKWQSILCHLLLINGFTPHYINDLMGIEWYIADLVILFALTPILYKWINSLKRSIIAFLLAILVAFILHTVFRQRFNDSILEDEQLSFFISTAGFFVQFPCMILGVVIYYLTQCFSKWKRSEVVLVLSCFCVIAFASSYAYYILDWRVISSSTNFALWGGVILTLLSTQDYLFENQIVKFATFPFCYLGRHSYGVYLFHFVIIRSIAQTTIVQNPISLLLWFILLLSIIVLTVLLGNALSKLANFLVGFVNKHLFTKTTLQ